MAFGSKIEPDKGRAQTPVKDTGQGQGALAPGQDPEREAASRVALRISPKADLVAVLGLGQGYHLKALRSLCPRARIIVWEPLAQVSAQYQVRKGALLKDGLRVEGVELVNSLAEMKSKIAQSLIYGPARLKCGLLIAEGYEEQAPEAVERINLALESILLRKKANLKTVREYSSLFLSNFKDNFLNMLRTPEAAAGLDSLGDVPGLIVAAGPSLEQDLGAIRELQGRAAIICVGTVFKRLVQEGIRPDAVVIIEPRDRSAQVSECSGLGSTLLALSSVGHPSHLEQRSAQNLIFHPQPWLSRLAGDWSHVPDGGNVASAAFTLGVLWGCNPLVMVGQDLSYSLGQRYAKGTGNEDPGFDPGAMTKLPGNQEEFVYASPELVSYLSWYEESAQFLSQARPDLRLVNATSGGARIDGFALGTLENELGDKPLLDTPPRDRLILSISGFKRDMDLVRLRLAELRREAAGLAALAEDSSVSAGELEEAVLQSPLGSFLAHLLEAGPKRQGRDSRPGALGKELARIGGFAAELQGLARMDLG